MMGLFDWVDNVLNGRADQITCGYIGKKKPITPKNGTYLTVDVEMLYIRDVRRVTSKFYGAMYGSISVPYNNGETREFQAIDSVAQLKELDASNLDNIAQGPFCLLDDVPYYDTGIDVRVSLLAVKSADLAAPYISLLKTLADTAGVAFLSQITPFADAIGKGIAGLINDNTIEIGRFANFRPIYEGEYAVIRTDKERLPLETLAYDANNRRLLSNGTELTKYSYFVLKFSSSSKRENWYQIPEIKSAYNDLIEQVQKTPDNKKVNMQAFKTFKTMVTLSPELLEKDADRLIEGVRKHVGVFISSKPVIEKEGIIRGGQPERGQPFTVSVESSGVEKFLGTIQPASAHMFGKEILIGDHQPIDVINLPTAAKILSPYLKDIDLFDKSI
jgi:hypothetical protein